MTHLARFAIVAVAAACGVAALGLLFALTQIEQAIASDSAAPVAIEYRRDDAASPAKALIRMPLS